MTLTNAILQLIGHHQLDLPFPPGQMRRGLSQEIAYITAEGFPKRRPPIVFLAAGRSATHSVKSVQNHATLHPAALNTLYRLSQHTHLVLCHSTPFAEV